MLLAGLCPIILHLSALMVGAHCVVSPNRRTVCLWAGLPDVLLCKQIVFVPEMVVTASERASERATGAGCS